MDNRDNKWFSQLQIPGVAKPINRKGSIISIVAETIKDLTEANPRGLKDGECEIVLRFALTPFGDEKVTNTIGDIAARLNSQVDESQVIQGPESGETYEQYVERLMERGLNEYTALWMAADWFDMPEPEGLRDWMADEKAQRFRELNSRQVAFDSALPMEYETLKHYVISNYPQFTKNLTFRTA